MIFLSVSFILFIAIYSFLNAKVNPQIRIYLICVGSSLFYGYYDYSYLWVLFYFSALCFLFGPLNEKFKNTEFLSIFFYTLCLVPLFFYKYFEFLLSQLFSYSPDKTYAIPIGLSFITFTALSYLVEVSRGRFLPVNSFGNVFAYISYFPQLIAGPILRPNELIPQLGRPSWKLVGRVNVGVTLFTWGCIKKFAGDLLGGQIDPIWTDPQSVDPLSLLVACYGFSFQIYLDFSGYTDMALGVAYFLGVKLPKNFARPYFAGSVREFWRRWHITLSSWIRDYIYIPLGGRGVSAVRGCFNLTLTMLVAGLWHGAGWGFIVWGLLHGLLMSVERFWVEVRSRLSINVKIPRFLAVFITFNLVTVLWIFFRAESLTDAIYVLRNILFAVEFSLIFDDAFFSTAALCVCIFFIIHYFDCDEWLFKVQSLPPAVIVPFCLITVAIVLALTGGQASGFIYFDF